jgi:hypothetical protein
VEESPLSDPSVLVYQGSLHHGDLSGGSAEGLQ